MPEAIVKPLLWLIPTAPLFAALITAFASRRTWPVRSHWPCVTTLMISFVASLVLLVGGIADKGVISSGYEWINVGGLSISVDLRADAMSAVLLVTVTFVSLLVAVYSSSYMKGDPGYGRYFTEVALFVFSMCMLVLADNLLVLFVFWEGVGLCSYLLIGFWFERPAAAAAAKKAFVCNRIGDVAFLIGLFLIWRAFGSLDFSVILNESNIDRVLAASGGQNLLVLISLLLFLGAAGKSAQFPLHVWLPDAMEGPTPVSALIHAATMVTAGVYLVARCTPLYLHAPEAQLVVAGVGAFTAILAALIALTQYDLKRVLAYSTISQLGYMFLALGSAGASETVAAAAVTAAMFHLVTHAFFKALLFLSAGSVMHSMGGVIDMREFGGLRRLMPITHAAFLCGAAALAGVPLLAGFWSKDEILSVVAQGTHSSSYGTYYQVLLAVAVVTAVLTAFYTFRAYFLTFWGPERIPSEAGQHAHESPPVMTWPLVLLSMCAVFAGLLLGPTGLFAKLLEHTPGLPPAHPHQNNWGVVAAGTIAALIGISFAGLMYYPVKGRPERVRQGSGLLFELSSNRFYLDEFFNVLIVVPLTAIGWLGEKIDRYVIDGVVNLVGFLPVAVGRSLRSIQNGVIPTYALLMFVGLVAAIVSLAATR